MNTLTPAAVFSIAVALSLGAAPMVSADVQSVRSSQQGERTRVVFDLSRETDYELFRLESPERIVIDLPDSRMLAELESLSFVSPIGALRSGTHDGGVLRLVLDLDREGLDVKNFVLAPDEDAGRGHRLVVDIEAVTPAMEIASQAPVPEIENVASTEASTLPAVIVSADQNEAIAEAQQESASIAPTNAQRNETRPEPRPRRKPKRETTVDFSGVWWHEWAWATESSESQKFESIIQPRWDVSFGNGVDLTAILRIRGDGVGDIGPGERKPPNYSDVTAPWYNSESAELSLRELYVDFRVGDVDWRLGKQQVVWGQADGIKVLDIVNPQSWREFILDDFDDSRIPLWTANVTVPLGDSASLQLLWIPDTTYHEFPEVGRPFEFTTRRIIPQVPITGVIEVDKPDDPLADSEAGFALSGFVGGWDLSLNYLYRYLDAPVLPVRIRGPLLLQLEPEYERSHMLGGSFSNVFGDITFRGEVAYNSDTFQPTNTLVGDAVAESAEVSSVVGLDWAANMDTLISAQWFNSYLFDHVDPMGRDEHEQMLTLLYQQDFANATWRFRGIGIHSINDGDTQLQLRLSYWASSVLEVWIGGDAFSGDRTGLFGQFNDNDRVLVGFEYGF